MNSYSLFESSPGKNIALLPDAPLFTIAAVTNDYVNHFGLSREQLVGKSIFEVFHHHFDPDKTADQALIESLNQVLAEKRKHVISVERHPGVTNNQKKIEQSWELTNVPVSNEDEEVAYIIQHCEVKLQPQIQSKDVERSQNLFLQAPIVIGVVKGDQYLVELANEGLLEIWGRTKEVIGKPLLEAIPELSGQGFIELLAQVKETGISYHANEAPIKLTRNGKAKLVYMNFIYKAFYEHSWDKKASGVIAIGYDVTELVIARKKVEESETQLHQKVAERTEALTQQKAFISSILDVSFDGIYALRALRNEDGSIDDFIYLFANRPISKLLNLPVEQVIGSSMLTLLPENLDNGFFELFCKLLETGESLRDETHFVAQGIDSWYSYSIVPMDSETLVVSTQDISAQKNSTRKIEEQRNLLDSILQNSSNGISVSRIFRNDDGKVIDALTILANDAAVRYIGLPREIYLTKKATEIEPSVIDSPYYQACIKTLESGEPFVMQYYMQSTQRWLELTVSRLDSEHLIQIFTDVTPIKEAQLQLEKSVEELKRSNQSLQQFAYAASHDLKEPMRKINLFSDRLRSLLDGKLDSDHHHYFNRIMHATDRMNTLIDDLLLYSSVSIESVVRDPVNLNEIVKLSLEDLEIQIEENRAVISVGLLPTIKGQGRQLQQLFQNLIGNAIKYRKTGTPCIIEINSRLVEPKNESFPVNHIELNHRYHLVEVKDNGIGFSQKDANRVFDVFTRLHGNAEYKGTGVGLSIVRKIVETHGGYIWAESEVDKGASFKILFPYIH